MWTRIKRNVSGGNKEGECWLRNYQPSASECDSCDSGVMECEVYDHTDYTTTDDLVSTFVTGKTKSDQDCCGLCYNNSGNRSARNLTVLITRFFSQGGKLFRRQSFLSTGDSLMNEFSY